MKQHLTSTIEPIPEIDSVSFDSLLNVLNARYVTGDQDGYYIEDIDGFEDYDTWPRIVLPDDLLDHERATRAIATIITVTGSPAWFVVTPCAPASIPGPLKFSLAKRGAWAGCLWLRTAYLVAHFDVEFNATEAKKQLAAVVAHLSDDRNLIPLDAEVRALF